MASWFTGRRTRKALGGFGRAFPIDLDLLELKGTTCFEGELVIAVFVVADGAEHGELGWEAAGTILADEAPKCATSGDGLNLVKPTLGRGETGRRTRCGDVTLLFNGYPLEGITAEVDVVLEGALLGS